MKKHLLLALSLLAVTAAGCAHSGPSTEELEARIADLESAVAQQGADAEADAQEENKALNARVAALEAKVKELESKGARPRRPTPEPQKEAYAIPVGKGDHILGSRQAKVSLVVFTDFQCPFCSRTHPLMQQVVDDPELKGKVNAVYKHFPLSFHKNARPAAKAALAIQEQGDKYFWAYCEKLFAGQRELTEENFSKWAGEVGANVKKFERALKNNEGEYEERVQGDIKLGMNVAHVRGTPTLFVGGWQLEGERTVDAVKRLIKEKHLL